MNNIKSIKDSFEQLSIFYQERNWADGKILAQNILAQNQADPYANQFLGILAYQNDDLETAIVLMKRSIENFPDHMDFYCNLSEVYRKKNANQESRLILQKAVTINPSSANVYYHLGLTDQLLNKTDKALENFDLCLKYQPDHVNALYNANYILQSAGRYSEAIRYCQKMISFNLKDTRAWNAMGVCCHKQRNYELAEQCFEKALQIDPSLDLAHENLGVLWLLHGHLKKGFLEYQWFRKQPFERSLPLTANIENKHVLVYEERGFGDTIQFARYLPLLKEKRARVTCCVSSSLLKLFANASIVDHCVTQSQIQNESFDYTAGILFLPCFFQTTMETIPSPKSYLKAPSHTKRALKETIDAHRLYFNIGIIWAGNPQNENDIHRSMPLSCFEPLARIPGVQLFSFQKDQIHRDALKELPDNLNIIDLGVLFDNFADTASAIKQMDLMICVETSVAHLSGALGHPTWLLLPTIPDWRWLLDCDTSPWYQSLRIFRQKKDRDWTGLLEIVRNALLPVIFKKLYEKGLAEVNRKAHKQAYSIFETLSQIDTNNIQVWLRMGDSSSVLKNFNQSIHCYEKAIKIDPNSATAHYNLGCVWYTLRDYQKAIDCFQKAIKIKPKYYKAVYNLGSALYRIRELDNSIDAFQKALEIQPDTIDIYTNIGACYGKKGELETAISWHQKSIEASPDYADGHYNMGISLLLGGRLRDGFQKYEWRLKRPDFPTPGYEQPLWDGTPFKNQTLLAYMEQGFGDAIQFVRYLPKVKALGGTVLLVCHPSVVRLLQTSSGVDQVIPEDHPLPFFDYHISLMSLPAIFKTGMDTIPNETPYLSAPYDIPEKLDHHINKHRKSFNLGFVWAGNPSNKHDHDRSIPLYMFASIANIEGIQMFSLQKDKADNSHDLFSFVDLSAFLQDFSETAYAISKLDLIISVDTAVAHLAGALHRPTWLLLPKIPDWRWLMDRADSPWYASIQLFRQKTAGNWDDVFKDVIQALKIRINHPDQDKPPELLSSAYATEQLRKQGDHYFQKNQFDIAIQKYQESLSIQPDQVDILFNLGVSYLRLGHLDSAIGWLKKTIQHDPKDDRAYNNIGIACQRLGETHLAIDAFETAIQYNGSSPQYYYNLGNAYKADQSLEKAEKCYKKAIDIQPDFSACLNNLANLYIDQSLYNDAMKLMDQALSQCDEHPEFYFNKGIIYSRLEQHDDAIQYFRKATDMNPDFIDAYYSMSFCLLVKGDLKQGLKLHEWRIPKSPAEHSYHLKRWKGEPFPNKTLLVYSEQGFGDCIHFVRYLPQVKEKGGTVVLGCARELHPLFLGLEGVDILIKEGDSCPSCDYQVSLLSLAFLCDITFETIPGNTPYLFVNEKNHDIIDPLILPHADQFRIGIVWAGNAIQVSDKERSIYPQIYEPLNHLKNVQVFSFQIKSNAAEICERNHWVDLGSTFNHFADTAYAASQMNLILTVCTSMAHLAGALALPVWVLIPRPHDWRWFLEGNDSPWYPGMRLFRRQKEESWEKVFERVICELMIKIN